MLIIDIIGWVGTILMFGGSILSIYKHVSCWPLWIIGGIALGLQALDAGLTNAALLQIMYIPLNIWGLYEWRRDDAM